MYIYVYCVDLYIVLMHGIVYETLCDDVYTPDRHLPTPRQRGHSPHRHTAAGIAAPPTTDTQQTRGLCAEPGSGPSERGEHRPFEWGRRVCGGLSSALGVVRCGRSAGWVLCVLWAISAAVWGGSTLWG